MSAAMQTTTEVLTAALNNLTCFGPPCQISVYITSV